MIQVNAAGMDQKFLPELVCSMILRKAKETAQAYLGTKVNDAVVIVPEYFNNRRPRMRAPSLA